MLLGKNSEALLCWSGGRDSTLLLENLLAQRTIKVRTITITHPRVGGEKMQKLMRDASKKKLVEKYGDFHSEEVTISDTGNGIPPSGCVQAMLWLPLATLHLEQKEDLYMGYIRGDDVWHYRSQMYDLFQQCQSLLEKRGQLICPLEWSTKYEIIEELNSKELLKTTWFCQTDNLTPCGLCTSCITDQMANHYLEMKNKKHTELVKGLKKLKVNTK